MFRSLFGRKTKNRPLTSQNLSLSDSIKDAVAGDVFTIQGLSLEYDDVYFFIEKIDRYENPSGVWYEITGADGDKQVWVEWSQGDTLFVTATNNRRPVGLSAIGLTEEDLIRLDEENSIDNFIDVDNERYLYRSSSEALYFKDNRGQGDGFYLWEFISEGDQRVLAITKWEGLPFESYFSEVISPENVILYKGDRPESRS
ncbi:MAG: hypothetical protein IIB31_08115 [Chloroflexi bacterium]|nr:hypothetical protein [Chloroflexota bacterium]